MLDDKSKAAQYWSTNLRLILGSLIVWAFVSYGCGILFRGMLSDISVGGADLGFWFAQQALSSLLSSSFSSTPGE